MSGFLANMLYNIGHMKEGAPQKQTKSERIAQTLRIFINSGIYPQGTKLRTTAQFSDIFRASKTTIDQAMNVLSNERLIVREKGRGTFVGDSGEMTSELKFTPGEIPRDDQEATAYARAMINGDTGRTHDVNFPDLIPLVITQLDPQGFPPDVVDDITQTLASVLATEKSFPFSQIVYAARAVITDASALRGLAGDPVAMALRETASFYLGTQGTAEPLEKERTRQRRRPKAPAQHDVVIEPKYEKPARVTIVSDDTLRTTEPEKEIRQRLPTQLREEESVVLIGETEDITERELPPLKLGTVAALSAAVGNNEAKAILFIMMQPGVGTSSNTLYHLLHESQTGDAWTKLKESTITIWAEHSFKPIDLISIGTGPSNHKLFTRTEDEIGHLAEAFSGRSLVFSAEHSTTSLSQLQAARLLNAEPTVNSINGTFLRIRIIQKLARANGAVTQREIAYAIFGESYTDHRVLGLLDDHLQRLSDVGLITLEKREKGKPYARFAVKEAPTEDNMQHLGNKKLSNQILSVLFPQIENGHVACPSPFTYDILYKILCVKFPEVRDFADIKAVHGSIQRVVKHLVLEGIIENVGLREGVQKRIHVPESSRLLFSDYASMIDDFRNGNNAYFDESIRLGRAIVDNPLRYSQLLAKAEAASSHTDKQRPSQAVTLETPLQEQPIGFRPDGRGNRKSQRVLRSNIADDLQSRLLNGETIVHNKDTRYAFAQEYDISVTAMNDIFSNLNSNGLLTRSKVSTREERHDLQSGESVSVEQTADLATLLDFPYIQDRQLWYQEVRRRGGTPSERKITNTITPPESIAKVLRIIDSQTVKVTRIARSITNSADAAPVIYDYDLTQIFVPTDFPDDESDIAQRTRKHISKREPTQDIARRYGINENTLLVSTVTANYNKNGTPISIRIHTIPETRLPQDQQETASQS